MTSLRSYAAIAAVMLVLTGCGDDNDSNNNSYNDNGGDQLQTSITTTIRDAKFLTDADGYTLYTFDADTAGVSNCAGMCAVAWPYFDAGSSDATFTTITTAGESHTALFGKHPLYTYFGDSAEGQTYGDWALKAGGYWNIVYEYANFTETDAVKLSAETHSQTFLTDADGMALYTFDNDVLETNGSITVNCTEEGNCTGIWPVYYVDPETVTLPTGVARADLGEITHPDGGKQTTYKDQPLYYFYMDTQADEVKGDWVNGVWHLVELIPETIEETTQGVTVDTREAKYLTDNAGNTLYTFDLDEVNASNCVNGLLDSAVPCQTAWPDFNATVATTFPFDTLPDMSGGTSQNTDHMTLYGHPLYYFINDNAAGDTNGQLVSTLGFEWHVIHEPAALPTTFTDDDANVAFSSGNHTHHYLTDNNGFALYTYDLDETNVSNCGVDNDCITTWPLFDGDINLMQIPESIKADFNFIVRDEDGLRQTTYKGQPLYYFANDTAAGETKGDWVKGVWHLVDFAENPTVEPEPTGNATAGATAYSDKNCAFCHGAEGTFPVGASSTIIANLNDSAFIVNTLTDMRDNGSASGKAPQMVSQTTNLTDQEILDLSAYITTLTDTEQ